MSIALIANTAAGQFNVSSTVTSAIDTTGANLLVVAVVSYGAAVTVTDSKGNTWTPLTEYGSGGNRVRVYYSVPSSVGSGHTFTGTGINPFPAIAVAAFSGAHATPFDAENGAALSAQTGSVSPSEGNEVLVAALCFYPSGTISIDSGFTITNQVDYSASNLGVAMAYKIQTTAGAENPTFSTTTSFAERASALAAFKSSGGGSSISAPQSIVHLQSVRRASVY